jgi:hypothetical protein
MRDREVLLRVTDDRGDWMFEVDGICLDELCSGLEEICRQHLG